MNIVQTGFIHNHSLLVKAWCKKFCYFNVKLLGIDASGFRILKESPVWLWHKCCNSVHHRGSEINHINRTEMKNLLSIWEVKSFSPHFWTHSWVALSPWAVERLCCLASQPHMRCPSLYFCVISTFIYSIIINIASTLCGWQPLKPSVS